MTVDGELRIIEEIRRDTYHMDYHECHKLQITSLIAINQKI